MKDLNEKELSKALGNLREAQEKAAVEYGQDAENFWNSLSYDDKLMCFYAVTKRIYQGDILDKGTYRHVLYSIFGFGPDAYGIGMSSGYFAIHNSIEHKEEEK